MTAAPQLTQRSEEDPMQRAYAVFAIAAVVALFAALLWFFPAILTMSG